MVGKINETNDHEISPPSLPNGWSVGWSVGDLGEDVTKKIWRRSDTQSVKWAESWGKVTKQYKIGRSVIRSVGAGKLDRLLAYK